LEPTLGQPRIAAIQGSAVNARIREELEPRFSDRVNFFDSIGPTGKIIITLTAKTATKGAALASACEHLGIAAESVLAFGDAENDLSMFAAAGTAVAMGQADARVQQAADYVTGRNDESGVAAVISALLSTGALPSGRS
jgi:hydroxymethylpyrimidine pyrophosphatase-like HAD family hydrolase